MPERRVAAGPEIAAEAVMDVPPMVRAGILRWDVFGLDLVDAEQYRFDLRPAGQPQQRHSTGGHEWRRRIALAGAHGLQDIDPALDRAVVVRGPADESEDPAGIDTDDTNRSAFDRLLNDPTEAQPALDAAFDPRQLDGRAPAHERFSPL